LYFCLFGKDRFGVGLVWFGFLDLGLLVDFWDVLLMYL